MNENNCNFANWFWILKAALSTHHTEHLIGNEKK
jgi:hypothetical protein